MEDMNPFSPNYVEPEAAEAPEFEPAPKPGSGRVVYHADVVQGSEEWAALRCGILTASEMKLIITPTLKIASNDKERAHLYELLAQRITKYVEPQYVSDDMLRGVNDELVARDLYVKNFAPVAECGFITNDKFGFTLGYSPDGLVGDDGALEAKSRRQKYQIQTLVECVSDETIPVDYVMQHQTGLLVSERQWIDFLSFSGGLHMPVIRVYPDPVIQNAIIEASGEFERRLAEKFDRYNEVLALASARLVPTERQVELEMFHS